MTPEPKKKDDWSVIENVYALLENGERKLTPGEKRIIAGQRIINGILYEAISAILGTFPDESAPQAIKDARNLIADLPGNEPPGCCQETPEKKCEVPPSATALTADR